MISDAFSGSGNAKIVQFADEKQTLPDGSKVIYAESEDKIVIYRKVPFEGAITYVYDRKSGSLLLNGKEGNNADKRKMIEIGSYFLSNAKDDDLVTLSVNSK